MKARCAHVRSSIPAVLFLSFAFGGSACTTGLTIDLWHDIPEPPPPPEQPVPSPGPRPVFGPLVSRDVPPPPISGGTLAIDPSGKLAVASDPDRDKVYVVDLSARAVRHTVDVPPRSEPGRIAIDAEGRAHVALRASGEVATIDLQSGSATRRYVCTAPRGIAYDKKKSTVVVACAGGELETLAAAGGPAITHDWVAPDLRDVVLANGRTYATTFRIAKRIELPSTDRPKMSTSSLHGTNIAWRAVAAPNPDFSGSTAVAFAAAAPEEPETMAVVMQDTPPRPVKIEPGGYGGGPPSVFTPTSNCGKLGIVSARVELVGKGSVRLPTAVLPVDLATNGREFAVVAPGNAFTSELPQIFVVPLAALREGKQECVASVVTGNVPGQATAAAFAPFDGSDALIVQTREPAALHILQDRRTPSATISLATDSRRDTGDEIFHANAGGFIACASCHAEGGDDARAWNFVDLGPRRTPSLRGTLIEGMAFHWDGDMKDLRMLVDKVFVERMSGPLIDDAHVAAMKSYLYKLPPPPKMRAEADVPPRGRELFQQRCSSCHSGTSRTNGAIVDVGTGFAVKVPSLVGVAWRAPYIHTGCATTLLDRFAPSCGGGKHGDVRDLEGEQIKDLVKYLETL